MPARRTSSPLNSPRRRDRRANHDRSRFSSTASHARAARGSRLTVASETFSASAVSSSDRPHGEMFTDFSNQVGEQLRKLQQLEDAELAAVNKLMTEVQLPVVFVPPRKAVPVTM